jgi:hypothetical protein
MGSFADTVSEVPGIRLSGEYNGFMETYGMTYS